MIVKLLRAVKLFGAEVQQQKFWIFLWRVGHLLQREQVETVEVVSLPR